MYIAINISHPDSKGVLSIDKRAEELLKRNEQTQKEKDLLREQTQDFVNKRLMCLINDRCITKGGMDWFEYPHA